MIFKQLFPPFPAPKKGGWDKYDSPAVWQLDQILPGISIGEDFDGESPWQWGRKWKQAAFWMKHSFLTWAGLCQKKENQINGAPTWE